MSDLIIDPIKSLYFSVKSRPVYELLITETGPALSSFIGLVFSPVRKESEMKTSEINHPGMAVSSSSTERQSANSDRPS